ncbi:unnamed protein product [Pseudo-nitzschia multistriata]|uniref:Uncharacterized protein n=1 Tax=Pseudo-nitzschia multistriata TaxID=183589 RepID=A0A448YX93_9STRA|nr:unnamed protein product [Pseudo-nitzschia multistriata]
MFSKTVSKLLLPSLERDLTKAVGAELASASKMTDCFLSPAVYGYERSKPGPGLGHATPAVEQRGFVEKIHYKPPEQGLFR